MQPYRPIDETATEPARRGLLLVGHGTANPDGRAEMLLVARQLAAQSDEPVEPCFLELAEPTIRDGMGSLYARGVRRLTAVPLLLFAAGHAKRDIPQALDAAQRDFPDLSVDRFAPPFGCHPRLLELSAKRFQAAVHGHTALAADQIQLILVGRGSKDQQAVEAMRQFTRLRCGSTPVRSAKTCFMAMASPSLAEAIASVEQEVRAHSTASPRRAPRLVVVQPHLLFRGGLLAQVARLTAEAAARTKTADWLVTGHLGPDDLLVRAIVESVGAATGVATWAGD